MYSVYILDIRKQYKKLDVLINNAAINPTIAYSVLINPSSISQVFETNIISVMKVCQKALS